MACEMKKFIQSLSFNFLSLQVLLGQLIRVNVLQWLLKMLKLQVNCHLPWPRATEASRDSRSATIFNSDMVPRFHSQVTILQH